VPQPPSTTAELIGEVVAEYLLVEALGAGATSAVYLGAHLGDGSKAAVKILAPELAEDRDRIRRLLTEARVLQTIEHPNIVEVIRVVQGGGAFGVALVMEFVEGPTLAEVEPGSLSFAQSVGIALQVAGALEAAHAAGVVHRDVKPGNVLLTRDPRGRESVLPGVKLVDFGIAKVAGDAIGHQPATGIMIGTPAYMAPEQIAGSPPPSGRTDVYAVAELIYELLSGQRAYQSRDVDSVVHAKLCGVPPQLSLPEVHPGASLLPLIRACLRAAAHARPTMDDVYQALLDVAPLSTLKALGLAGAGTPLAFATIGSAPTEMATRVELDDFGPTLEGLLAPAALAERPKPLDAKTMHEVTEHTLAPNPDDGMATAPALRGIDD